MSAVILGIITIFITHSPTAHAHADKHARSAQLAYFSKISTTKPSLSAQARAATPKQLAELKTPFHEEDVGKKVTTRLGGITKNFVIREKLKSRLVELGPYSKAEAAKVVKDINQTKH